MSKQSIRRRKRKWLLAAESGRLIQADASVEWIQASADEGDEKPKTFSIRAYNGGLLDVGWPYPWVIDLTGLTAKAPFPSLLNHQPSQIVGHVEQVTVGNATIDVSGVVSGTGAAAEEVVGNAKRGFPWRASVGVRPDKRQVVAEGETVVVNGKTFTGPLYVARKSTLGEVSFVPMGADSKTSVKVAASAASSFRKDSDMNFDQWVQAMFGGDVPEFTDKQTAKLRERYDAEVKAAAQKQIIEGGQKPVVEAAAFDLAGVVRVAEIHSATIQAKASTYFGKIDAAELSGIQAKASTSAAELKVKALNEQWPAARLEVELLKAQQAVEIELIRAERPKGFAIHSSTRDVEPKVIEAAFCRSAGLGGLDRHYEPAVLEAADRFRGFGLQEMLLQAAAQAGYSGRTKITDGNIREVLKAAFSTHSVTTMLTSVGNKVLLDGFNAAPQTWREIAATRTVTDFKQVTAYRLTADLEYEEVGPAGKIKHGTLGQDSYTVQARTYAKMLTLTREHIINDDLGAFNDLRRRLGIGSSLKLAKIIWTCFLAARNAGTFWTEARGNLVTGAALGEEGLGKAVQAFREMKDADKNLLGIEPDRLIVPSALEPTARKWYTSQEMRDTTASTKTPTANIYQNRFRPVVVPELGSSAYAGYSATTYHLMGNPAYLSPIVVSFLNGQESPTIESSDADFDTLGIAMRGYHDFGADMADWLGSVECQA